MAVRARENKWTPMCMGQKNAIFWFATKIDQTPKVQSPATQGVRINPISTSLPTESTSRTISFDLDLGVATERVRKYKLT